MSHAGFNNHIGLELVDQLLDADQIFRQLNHLVRTRRHRFDVDFTERELAGDFGGPRSLPMTDVLALDLPAPTLLYVTMVPAQRWIRFPV